MKWKIKKNENVEWSVICTEKALGHGIVIATFKDLEDAEEYCEWKNSTEKDPLKEYSVW